MAKSTDTIASVNQASAHAELQQRIARIEASGETNALRKGHRSDLVSRLFEARELACAVGEPQVARVLEAIESLVAHDATGILSSKEDRRVGEWATKVLAKERRGREFHRVGNDLVVTDVTHAGSLDDAIAVLLRLPWTKDERESARHAVATLRRAGFPEGRPRTRVPWELEQEVEREVTEGSWRKRSTLSAASYVKATLRAIGFDSKRADNQVRAHVKRQNGQA